MTRFLLIATVILVVMGIPVSTIYWWPHFWGPQFSLATGYWNQWSQGLKIAFAVLAALWILDLVLWMKAKREESKFYRNRAITKSSPEKYAESIPTFEGTAPPGTPGASPRGPDWIVDEHGQARRPYDEPQGEPISYIVPEPLRSESPFEHGADFLTNQTINRLLEEGKITIKEAEAIRRQTKNMDFLGRESFLSAIEHRAERERHERDRSPESIAKKYGIFRNRFRL